MTLKPNILIYSSNSTYQKNNYGGAETSLRLIAEKLAKNGINVTYFTNGNTRIPGTRKKRIKGVDVYYFTPWRWPLIKNRIFPLFSEKLVRKQKQRALARLIKKKNISIVHTYDIYVETFDVLEIRSEYNLQFKIVLRMAGLYWAIQLESQSVRPATIEYVLNNIDMINFLVGGFETLFIEKCNKFGINFIAPSKFTQDIGIDCNYYKARKKQPQNNNFTIVCSARFCNYAKRQDLLIDALIKLNNQNIYVEFAGEGETLEKYKMLVKKFSLDHMVKFHGYVTKKRLMVLMEKADLVALPTDYEGLGKSIIEAMAMKIPVLVSDVVPLNNYLTNNETAFLVKNNAENWAETILKLSNDRKLLYRVADAGYLLICEKYNADINIIQYIEAFQNL